MKSMKMDEFIELYKKEGELGIRGQFILAKEFEGSIDEEAIIGLAKEDIKKGDTVRIVI